MSGLTLVDALVYHEVLARIHAEIPPLSQIRSQKPIKKSLEDAWHQILKMNYEPIFDLACDLLSNFAASQPLEKGLELILDQAEKIASSKTLLRHDLMGRIYHTLLMAKIAKYYATYYTSIPSASLLARLSLETENPYWKIDWANLEEVSKFRIGDLACGSGTLLSAAYTSIVDKHVINSASKEQEPDVKELHSRLMENTLWGFDILSYAAHLTVTTLALHNPESTFNDSNIFVLPLGIIGKEKRMGSLDLLRTDELTILTTLTHERIAAERRSIKATEKTMVKVPPFQLIIMNPPFTRSVGGNLLFGDLPKDDRTELQNELRAVHEEKKMSGIGQAGLGADFIVLGDKYLMPGGRLALVAPRSLLSGVAWQKIRKLLIDGYNIEYLITSHQPPNDWNFSENTDLSECLLVARKERNKTKKDKTVIINFWIKPSNEFESIILSKSIIALNKASPSDIYDFLENPNASFHEIKCGGRKYGEAYVVSRDLLEDYTSTWGALSPFAQSSLNYIAFEFISSGVLNIPSYGISAFFPIISMNNILKKCGPDRSQVHQSFSKAASKTAFETLWGHKSTYITRIALEPNANLKPKPGKQKSANDLWISGSGRLLVAEGLWLNANKIVAVYLPTKALSNVWWPLQLEKTKTSDMANVSEEEHEKIQVLWLNSTLGILGLLSYRQDTRGGWIGLKKDILRLVPTLDLTRLKRKQVNELIALYQEMSNIDFSPLPQQFKDAASGSGPRFELDAKLIKVILGNQIDLNTLYRYLSREPIISLEPLVRKTISATKQPSRSLEDWL